MKTSNDNAKNLTIAMILSMVIWGISWPSASVLTQYGNPIDLGVFRYVFVIVSLLGLLIALKIPLKIKKQGIGFVLISGIIMAFYNFTFLKGLQVGSPGAGGILVTIMNPLMAYAIGLILSWRKPTTNEAIGLTLGLIGGSILLKLWSQPEMILDSGNVYFLLSALLWATMSKFTSKSGKYGSPFAFTWWLYVTTTICLLPFMGIPEIVKLTQNREWEFWGNLLFGSVITTSLATTVYFYATSKIGAEKASSFIFTVPFTAAISSFLILGETIEIHTLIGGLIGIGAVYMINKKPLRT